ncbi:MAG: protein phosphatase 2C domain-containing protein [Hyphomicrobiales bacterium]|nr:protein phosphatase 2C domain-containing protein [Hyphomicrobiales bacterium]
MGWTIECLISKPGRDLNEDAAGATGNLAWVLDGARSPVAPRFGPSDAAWLVGEIDTRLQAAGASGATLDDALARLASALPLAWGPADDADPAGGPTNCLALLHLEVDAGTGGANIEAAVLGDVVVLMDGGDGPVIWTDERVRPFEARTIAVAARCSRAPDGTLGPEVAETIRANRRAINTPHGFAVVSPVRPWLHLARRFSARLAPGSRLALMSDGFWRLVDPFEMMSPRELLDALLSGEADALLARLRAAERDDGDAGRWPRIKIHDDATVMVVRV